MLDVFSFGFRVCVCGCVLCVKKNIYKISKNILVCVCVIRVNGLVALTYP